MKQKLILTKRVFKSLAAYYAAFLCFCYLCIYAIACPKSELLIAISFEIIFFAALCLWRLFRSRSQDVVAQRLIVDELVSKQKTLGLARHIYRNVVLVGWILVNLALTLDLVALGAAVTNNLPVSESIYVCAPVSLLIGAHPAVSAEVLEGAYVEAGKFDRAEPLLHLIARIREKLYGPRSEMSVAIYADFGDFFYKQKQFAQSEIWYQKAITLSKSINGKSGYGRPLTGLGNCFREVHEYRQARLAYDQALQLRLQLYGPHSEKVADTLRQLSLLCSVTGDPEQARQFSARANQIHSGESSEQTNAPIFLIAIVLISTVVTYLTFGPQGLLTNIAVRSLKNKVTDASIRDAADLRILATLYKYQKDEDGLAFVQKFDTFDANRH